jgi:hypothetical protein
MGSAASWVGAGSVGVGVAVSVGVGAADSVGVDVGVGTGDSVAIGVAIGVGLAVASGVTGSAVDSGLGVAVAGGVCDMSPSSYIGSRDGGSSSGAVDQSPSSQMELGVRGRASRTPSFGSACGIARADGAPSREDWLLAARPTVSSKRTTVRVAVPRGEDTALGVKDGRPDGIDGTARTASGIVPRSPGRIGW